ncbi:MAG: alkaline phosphatase family protein [Planctomycetales bacterium]|nr:alkaline phosphatase family protein [Planctomycetales bacterium]
MFRQIRLWVICVCAGLSTVFAEPPTNIVVIGWDGAQRDHVKEMIAGNELPNLMALCKEGKLIDIDVTDGMTDTKAGWSQILTGYRSDITGVYRNSRYQPIPEGYSVFERLESFFGPQNIVTLAVIGKKDHVDNDAPRRMEYDTWLANEQKQGKIDLQRPGLGNLRGGRIIEENGKKYVDTPGKPWYFASRNMDLFVNGLDTNERVALRAMAELAAHKESRFFLFVHFANPDHAGHKRGENSQAYSDAIRDDDAWTGKITAKLKELGLYDKTLVYVVVDHGFDEDKKGHNYAPYVFLGTNDSTIIRDGDRMDIAPTILKRYGMDLAAIKPALSGKPLDEPAARKVAPARNPNIRRPLPPPPRRLAAENTAEESAASKGEQTALEQLKETDVDKMTPLEAKRLLTEIKKEMGR